MSTERRIGGSIFSRHNPAGRYHRSQAYVLLSAVGKTSVKRALSVIDTIEKEAKDGLISVPESYWLTLHNTLLLRKSPRDLPLSYRNNEAFHVS